MIRRIFAIAYRYFLLLRDNPTRVFQIFVWAFLDIVLWGFITRYLDSVGAGRFSFAAVLLGAVMLWAFLSRVQQGVSTPFLEDVWSHNLLNLFASPLRIGEYTAGLMLISIVTSAAGLLLMILLTAALFGFSLLALGMYLAPLVLVLFLFGIALGVLATAIVLRLGPSAEWFVWPIPVVLSPFVGVYYPVTVLPEWMQAVSRLLPPTYVFDGMRTVLAGGAPAPGGLAAGFALAALYLALAYAVFAFVYKRAVQSGAVARYSAESSF